MRRTRDVQVNGLENGEWPGDAVLLLRLPKLRRCHFSDFQW